MSVAALTMDDQRPLMNNFETMKKQYDHITNAGSGVGVGAAVAAAAGGGVVHNVGSSTGGGVVGGVAFAAPASGPASPTPSTCEEQQQQQHAHHHHHHHHHHAASLQHNHHTQHHQQHQLQQPTTAAATTTTTAALQQQQLPYDANAAAAAVAVAEQRQRLLEEEIESLKVEQSRLSQQCADAQRREKILMRRLANKEQEFQDYGTQIAEYKAAQAPSAAALRSALLDPAVNLLFEKLKKELKATKAKLEETQNELSAWKFTPDSNTGKRLMAKCRLLYQENEELGKMTSNGRLAKLETELAMQKSFSEEVKKSQSEFDDLVQELDEDVEGMQSTILFLQQELKTTRDRIQLLEKENYQLKTGNSSEQTDVTNSSCCNEQQIPSVNGNNGLIVDTTANIINNIINSQTQPAANLNIAQKQHKFQALDTIDENNCLRTTATTTTNEFYNGLAVDQPAFAATAVIAVAGGVAHDEGSNSNGSNGSNNKLRSAGSRKRNYDSDQDQNASAIVTAAAAAVPAPVQHIVTPRTLPPKKSKLRLTPARRASIQASEIMLDSDNALPMCGTPNLQAEPACNPFVVDNAVAGMANEEGANLSMAVDEDNNAAGGVAQRIMTRRRSVRNAQQNGDSNH